MTDNRRRMGRPPLKSQVETITTVVRLPADVRDRIVEIAGPNRMAGFIREAIDEKIERMNSAEKPKG